MGISITIRDVPPETRDELAARAATSGKSLQEYLRAELIALAEKPDPATFWTRVSEHKHVHGTELSPEMILRWRDEDRP